MRGSGAALRAGRLAVGAALLALTAGEARAQAIERNLPPAPPAIAPALPAPADVPAEQDVTPLGPALRAVVILGPSDTVVTTAVTDGVDVGHAGRLNTPQARARLAGFLGRPLSRQLIAQVEAAIASDYRARGFPFVSVSTPEQEIGSGVLRVRVIEFHLQAKAAPGARAKDARFIASRIRLTPGDPIDARALSQDLDWLNRYPFRHSEAVFAPGASLGATVLNLQTTASRPWSAYAGYANSGSPASGEDRYFAGVQAALPYWRDAVASYQFTGSSDAVFENGRPFTRGPDPRYQSHAARLLLPTGPRQDVEASLSYVRSNQPVQDFVIRQTTYEARLAYRAALSNIAHSLPGEASVGLEMKRQTSRTLFGGEVVAGQSFDVAQAALGYAQQESDALGAASGEVTLHISPGGADRRNTGAALAAFSRGRSTSATYAYMSGDLSRYTRLGGLIGLKGWALSNALIGQYAGTPLPLSEQIGLGNNALVRGYTLEDGAFDAGIVSRNELRAPAFSLLRRGRGFRDQLSPYLFLDAGYGRDRALKTDAAPVSAGLGCDYALAGRLTISLDGALALRSVGRTRSGDLRLESRATINF